MTTQNSPCQKPARPENRVKTASPLHLLQLSLSLQQTVGFFFFSKPCSQDAARHPLDEVDALNACWLGSPTLGTKPNGAWGSQHLLTESQHRRVADLAAPPMGCIYQIFYSHESSLAVFKVRLKGALSNLIHWKVSLPVAGRLELDDL